MSEKSQQQDMRVLRNAAEMRLGGSKLKETTGTTEELLHELQVHQLELEMQNESLRQTQLSLEESRDRYMDLYDFAPVGYLTLSSGALITEINLTGAALLGEDRGKLIRGRFENFIAPEYRDNWRRHFLRVLKSDDRQQCEVTINRVDGLRFHARLDCLRQVREGESPVARISLADDTDRKRAEEELRIAAIAFETQEAMMVTDANGIIVRVNNAFVQLTGYGAEEALGRTPELLRSGRHDKAFYQEMWRVLREKHHWQGEVWNRRKNGKIYAEWLNISAVTAPDGQISHYVGTFSDITQSSEADAEIHRLAYYDALTELPNRRLLHDRLGQALAASARNGHCGAILFLDMDNFKMLNDTRGHEVGDLLLVEAGQRLHACIRAGDTVARLGGDEFVILLEELSGDLEVAAAQSKHLADKVLETMAEPFHLKGYDHHCTASIGVGLFRGSEIGIEELLVRADVSMYQAKDAGRNTLRFFDPSMQQSLDRRSVLESDLRQACAQQQLRLYYQPLIDSSRGVIGAEALLRWEHPERGLVMPGDFIPLAEETGLILPIGLWALGAACAQIKAWEDSRITRDLCLAINVSARQFRQPDFIAQVKRALNQSAANPTHLKIELTESLVLHNVSDTISKMQSLRDIGVGFAMDDFGTGYSSLSYLKQLPLDQLKIDRSFISEIPSNSNDAAIALAIITMGLTFGLDVIAEGVETLEQQEFLQQNGCHAFQGYLFSRPLPPEGFERFLQ